MKGLDGQIEIVIADDHPLIRKGLRLSIEEDPGLKLVAEAENGEVALELVTKLQPDVAILDIEMPKLDGLSVARAIAKRNLKTKIIFLTLHADEKIFRTAIDIGSKGYLLKDSISEEVVAGVRAVAANKPYLSQAVTEHLLRHNKAATAPSGNILTNSLSPTERRVMRLIADGKSSKEIGEELSVHYRTIENHRTRICRKLFLEREGANALLRYSLQNRNLL